MAHFFGSRSTALILSLLVSFIESGCASNNILDGHVRVDALCANFEHQNWLNQNYRSRDDNYWHDPPPISDKRGIEHKKWVAPPVGSTLDSLGALEISRINDLMQQELLSPTFQKKLGKVLKRADKPVFIVRVYLPPVNLSKNYGFGFRQVTFARGIEKVIPITKDDKYSTSIWVKNDPKVSFYFRAANGKPDDISGGPMVESGWWTWAIAFDRDGIGHYYLSKGTNVPTSNDEVFDTTQFPSPNNPRMDEIEYSYFAISGGDGDQKFVIDDYEVWVAN